MADFAYNTMMYHVPTHIVAGLVGFDLTRLILPTEAEYIVAYCSRTGVTGIAGYPFHIAFNFFRLAAISHGIKGRVIRSPAASAQAALHTEIFPEIASIDVRVMR